MKSRINIKLFFFILTILFVILTIFLVRSTYARYITSLTAKSYVKLGSWLIFVNNQNIIQNSDVSDKVIPIFNSNTEYIAEGKIVPNSSGYVEITIDHTNVTVPFRYEISFEPDNPTALKDFKMTGYSINGIEAESIDAVIANDIFPDTETKTQTLKLNFGWLDGEGEILNDVQDTAFSHNVDELGLRFNMVFTQLQPTT